MMLLSALKLGKLKDRGLELMFRFLQCLLWEAVLKIPLNNGYNDRWNHKQGSFLETLCYFSKLLLNDDKLLLLKTYFIKF